MYTTLGDHDGLKNCSNSGSGEVVTVKTDAGIGGVEVTLLGKGGAEGEIETPSASSVRARASSSSCLQLVWW